MKKFIFGFITGAIICFAVIAVIGYHAYNPENRKEIGNVVTQLTISTASKDKAKIEKNIADLLKAAEKVELSDSEIFKIKYLIAKTYEDGLNDIINAQKYYKESEKIIPNSLYTAEIAEFYHSYADMLADKGESEAAIKKLEKVLYITRQLDDKNFQFDALEYIASLYGNLNNLEKMEYYFDEAEELMAARKTEFDEDYYYDLGVLYNNRAYSLYGLNQFEKADEQAMKSLEIYESDKPGKKGSNMLASVYDTVAVIKLELSDLKAAMDYAQKAVSLIKFKDAAARGEIYKNYSKILFSNQMADEGCKYLGQSIESFLLNGNDKEVLGLKRKFKEEACVKKAS